MKYRILLIIFFILCAVQLSVPLYIVLTREIVVNEGEMVFFKIRPVDPYDIFRGRYVSLSVNGFETDKIPAEKKRSLKDNKYYYVLLSSDKEGYSYLTDISEKKPGQDVTYLRLKCRIRKYSNDPYFNNPFDKFFVNQDKARRIEHIYWDNRLDRNSVMSISVRIKNGKGVITGLFINNKSIYDYFKHEKNR